MKRMDRVEFGGGALFREPFEEYQEKAHHCLTSHQLADFRKCPLLYYRKRLGLVADGEGPAYLVGRAAHALVLEGRDCFEEQFAVGGPINPRTGIVYGSNTKAFAEWAEAQGKTVLTREQFDLVQRMHLAVTQHELAFDLLAVGIAEGVVRRQYGGVDCQIRIDWFSPEHGIVDLKTCDDLTWFEADARRFGYAHQLAFYRAVLAQDVGELAPVYLVGVEKKEPHRCGVWKLDPQALDIAGRENNAAIERLKRCQASNVWPSGYEELRVFDSL